MLIVVLHEVIDLVDELLDVGERSAADGLLGDEPEPPLDLVDPGGVGRGVMLEVPVAALALGEHLADGDVDGGEQGRGTVSDIVNVTPAT